MDENFKSVKIKNNSITSSSADYTPANTKWKSYFITVLILSIASLAFNIFLLLENTKIKTEIKQAEIKTESSPKSIPTPDYQKPSQSPQSTTKVEEPITEIIIPSSWKEFSATDWDFNLTTTMSLPQGYSFSFSGSEFNIKNDSGSNDLWDYSSSIFRSKDGLKNYYDGTSRRSWYQKYLNGDFSSVELTEKPKIISVGEKDLGNLNYLEVEVLNPFSKNGETEYHYLYVQNNILHIIKPISDKAKLSSSPVAQNIDLIFSSLNSKFENQ